MNVGQDGGDEGEALVGALFLALPGCGDRVELERREGQELIAGEFQLDAGEGKGVELLAFFGSAVPALIASASLFARARQMSPRIGT